MGGRSLLERDWSGGLDRMVVWGVGVRVVFDDTGGDESIFFRRGE